jgi:hypothetical protein
MIEGFDVNHRVKAHIQALFRGLSGYFAPPAVGAQCLLGRDTSRTRDIYRLNEQFGALLITALFIRLGRLRLDTRPGLTRWRVTIHVSSASHLYPHWASGSYLLDT